MSGAPPVEEPGLPPSPAALAEAGLHYVRDDDPGITRRRAGRGFSYRGPDGRKIADPATLRWIRSLAVPPAWREVWISPDPKGHLLATGRDARGRKQYRYHPRWRAVREEAKFGRMLAFGRALPRIRTGVEADLAARGLGRRKVLALVVRLLETTLIRVGNQEYARTNRTFGLTTLRDRHLVVEGGRLRFLFRGKGGKRHEVSLRDRRLARLARTCQEIPGQELFQYLDEEGRRQPVDSGEVNDYLRELAGEAFSAKDFRTWSATVLAAWALSEFEAVDSEAAAKRNITQAIERVAGRLGNTPAICRKSYVHPEILDAYMDGSLLEALKERIEQELREDLEGLAPEEAAVLVFLQRRLAAADGEAAA
ncbi:DNA topoisomerase IB [Marinimicrococcus flavescens]|uniref:DNA topoisomerase n=1 Tax=Marinimicrococcus flavescens TaxID=3031815 RepID=A0AAP3V1I0_9PROT|nr:DNA topoisomerase IB [Marinimicrococcus flavescens]